MLGYLLRAGICTFVGVMTDMFLAIYMPACVRGMQWSSSVKIVFEG